MLKINSFQSLGAVDGPGIRFVVFMQGCNFKCKYCHNPETIGQDSYNLISNEELVGKIERYKNYIFDKGGVTFSGGEPLIQAKELKECFKLLKEKGYHTFGVSPKYQEIDGNKMYENLDVIPSPIDVVVFVINPKYAKEYIGQMRTIGIGYAWMQPGTYNDEILDLMQSHGITPILDCILIQTQ